MRLLVLMGILSWLTVLPGSSQHTVTVFYEDFDTAVDVNGLSGWEIGEGWDIDGGTPSSGSGIQSLRVFGGPGGPAMTPPVDLRRLTDGTLSFLGRRTNSFYENSIVITASIDGGLTFPILVADSTETLAGVGTSWPLVSFPLPAPLLGEPDVRFRFENVVGGSGSANAKFDDLTVAGSAIFDVEPPEGLFACEVGDVDVQSFTVTNYSLDPLSVDAPVLTGSVFSITPSAGVVIAPGDDVTYTITFEPLVEGVYNETLDITTSDAGGVTVPLLGLTALNQLSFSLETSTAGEAESEIPVDLAITFSNETANLQGVQLNVSWDDDIIELTGVLPGPAVANNGWSLSYEVTGRNLQAILYDDTGVGLAPDHYDPILTLTFDAGLLQNGPRDVALSIDDVIGALAVPTADDAELYIKQADHTLAIEKRYAYFTSDSDGLDFGVVAAGETAQLTFSISNPDGDRALGVTDLSFSGGPFTVDPATASIGPDASQMFTVTFAPTDIDFGLADVTLAISHDGELNGVFPLPVLGLGVSGRGDNDADGMVDAMDIINSVDFILGRIDPSALQLAVSDLYPFDAGDGSLDVRDLSVTVQGIVRGIWPDDVPLPPTYEHEVLELLAAKNAGNHRSVVVTIASENDDLVLELETQEPLRALQLHLSVEHIAGSPVLLLNSDGSPTASGRAESDQEAGTARILLYRPDGGAIQPGTYRFATIPRSAAGYVDRDYATAVSEGNQRRGVEIVGLVAASASDDGLPETMAVDQFYPNPFSLSASASVRLPVRVPAATSATLEVYDLLGRRLHVIEEDVSGAAEMSWDGRYAAGANVAPGVYLIRISSGSQQFVRQLVVLR